MVCIRLKNCEKYVPDSNHFSINIFNILGAVYSWGDGDYGKLGRGGSDGCKAPKVIERLMGQDVIKVYCGAQFSLALTKSGAVFSWYVRFLAFQDIDKELEAIFSINIMNI